MGSTGVLRSLMIELMVVLLAYFLSMVWFQIYGGVSAILENGYEIQGQNCVARLQGRVLWVWPRYRNFMVIWCFRWIVSDIFMWPNEQQSRLPFRRFVIVSQDGRLSKFDIVNPLSKSNRGRDRRPTFVFWVAGSVLFVSGWVAMAWSKVL